MCEITLKTSDVAKFNKSDSIKCRAGKSVYNAQGGKFIVWYDMQQIGK